MDTQLMAMVAGALSALLVYTAMLRLFVGPVPSAPKAEQNVAARKEWDPTVDDADWWKRN